ncbi:molecular chaperone DnaK [Pseudoalteromonas luteoviolacea]|uniref:Molecular chaperone DnaK n=1 Tax=Pseudoalteromonas luteoviolacea TaxID=43657 RepID=A0A1C0TSL6_9GAMM|nr:TraR/DksA C4-type zinc finger protein [Pseudoalteromonas luteoviolacea]MBQ4810876.1 TraR/DksA C4-type zinc finger protein [Pseudoalteromonas luteoviolacea]OCQ22213.1 molecular chaperone DnaK [Pseudoalteromonas luteoviolacea]
MTGENKELPLLTEQQILEAPESDYMNDAQLAFFKARLIELHDTTRERIREVKEHMQDQPDLADFNDRASWEEQWALSMRIVEREQKLLPKIIQSLERIRLGEYGYCMESGEPIGIPRLLARPTTEFCADVKNLKEVGEHLYKH